MRELSIRSYPLFRGFLRMSMSFWPEMLFHGFALKFFGSRLLPASPLLLIPKIKSYITIRIFLYKSICFLSYRESLFRNWRIAIYDTLGSESVFSLAFFRDNALNNNKSSEETTSTELPRTTPDHNQ